MPKPMFKHVRGPIISSLCRVSVSNCTNFTITQNMRSNDRDFFFFLHPQIFTENIFSVSSLEIAVAFYISTRRLTMLLLALLRDTDGNVTAPQTSI